MSEVPPDVVVDRKNDKDHMEKSDMNRDTDVTKAKDFKIDLKGKETMQPDAKDIDCLKEALAANGQPVEEVAINSSAETLPDAAKITKIKVTSDYNHSHTHTIDLAGTQGADQNYIIFGDEKGVCVSHENLKIKADGQLYNRNDRLVKITLRIESTTDGNFKLHGHAYLDAHTLNQPQMVQLRHEKDTTRPYASLSVLLTLSTDNTHYTFSSNYGVTLDELGQGTDVTQAWNKPSSNTPAPSETPAPKPPQQSRLVDTDEKNDFPEYGGLMPQRHKPKIRVHVFPTESDEEKDEETIKIGSSVMTTNGNAIAIFQNDGNIVVYHKSGDGNWHYQWASFTHNTGANKLVRQGDNNLVLYNSYGPLFWTGTSGWGPAKARLGLQDDGNMIYFTFNDTNTEVQTVLWHTGTDNLEP